MNNPLAPPTEAAPRRGWTRFLAWMDAHPFRALAVILLLALALNAARIAGGPPTASTGQTDRWWPIVLNLLQGKGYAECLPEYFPFCGPANQITASHEPLPVLLFTGAALLAGPSFLVAAIVELLLNLFVLLAVFFLTTEWAGKRAALVAAFLWAVYLPAIKLVPQVSGELAAALAVTTGAHFFLRARQTARARDWLAAGVCMGLAVLSRSALLIVAGTLTAGLVVEWMMARRATQPAAAKTLRPFVLFSLAVVVTLLPWFARNYIVFGRPVLGSTLTGYNLYRHNYMLESEDSLRFVGLAEGEQAVRALIARHPELRGTENEAQMDALYRDEAFRVIAARPLQYARLSAYHFFPLWFNWGIMEAGGTHDTALDYLMMTQQAALLVTAVLALRGLWPRIWPLAASLVTVSVAYMAVNSQMRFIIPVMPFAISLGAAGCLRLARMLSANRLRSPSPL